METTPTTITEDRAAMLLHGRRAQAATDEDTRLQEVALAEAAYKRLAPKIEASVKSSGGPYDDGQVVHQMDNGQTWIEY